MAEAFAHPAHKLAAQKVTQQPTGGQGVALTETGKLPSGVGGGAALTGQVDSAGATVAGTGFTSTKDSSGVYTITFTAPFAADPTCIAISQNTGGASITLKVTALSTTAVTFTSRNDSAGLNDTAFHFVVFATV